MRKRILELSQKEARALGINKSTLHYLRNRARGDRPFKVYGKVYEKLGEEALAKVSNKNGQNR